MALKLLGTREQKENKARNTGTEAVFREQGTPKSKKKMLLGNKGTQGKFCWEQGIEHGHHPLGGPRFSVSRDPGIAIQDPG